jgi:cellulose synthase/poly-beta-1,6-N-acetylglucosamine synthase-like glycosyltransferase
MHSIVTWVFWLSLGVTAYVYFGYPALLASGLLSSRKGWHRRRIQPTISVIVAAYNEEAAIEHKIKNLLTCDYPADRLEIVIGSDGSTDRTEEIVEQYAGRGVRLVKGGSRRGKSAIQNDAVATASGSILVFTDADCLITAGTLQQAIDNFADPGVGLVTGTAAFANSDESAITRNEGLYARYEAWIRQQESERQLLAAASGSFFAIRRKLWKPLDPNVGDDFVLPLQVALRGFRNVLDPNVIAWTQLPAEASSMFRVKKRIVTKDLRGLLRNWQILNPLHSGRVAVGLWSHKLLRWLVAYFLCALLLSNLFLLGGVFFRVTLLLQVLFYGIALGAMIANDRELKMPWSVASSFCVVNCAAMFGIIDYLIKGSAGQWRPVR